MGNTVITYITDVLFRGLFVTDIFVIGIILTINIPKRTHLVLRICGALAGLFLFPWLWKFVYNALDLSSILGNTVNYIICVIVASVLIGLIVQVNGWNLAYIGAACWLIQHATNDIDQLLPLKHTYSLSSYFIHMLLIVLVAFFVWFVFFRRVDLAILRHLNMKAVTPIILLMIIVCVTLNSYAEKLGQSDLAFRLLDLVCVIIMLMYQENIYRYYGSKREVERINTLMDQSRKQFEATRNSIEMVNIRCHDLKHQIHKLGSSGQIDESAIHQMEQAIDNYDTMVKTGNPAMDVILTEKNLLCIKHGICFTCMADGTGLSYMEPADLYALFGNALDNAIESTDQIADAEKKQIALTVNRHQDLCSISLQNYAENKLLVKDGLIQTTKEDSSNHGFGMKSMKILVARYNGELRLTQEDDMVELSILLPWKEQKS